MTAQKKTNQPTVKAQGDDPIPKITAAQIVAVQLRRQAAELILLAQQLEATVPRPPKREGPRKTSKQIVQEMGIDV